MSHGRSQRRKARWGQNFLVNVGAAERIVAAAGDLAGRGVVEVGPGHGVLTRLLAGRAARVIALEIDPALAAELSAELEPAIRAHRVAIRLEDAVEADWIALGDDLRATPEAPAAFVANLPYESGTAILGRWLAASAADPRLDPAVVMLQREVAERIAAQPSTKAYGALSVLAQATHRVRTVLDVAPGSFRPMPKVFSRVLHLKRRADPLFEPPERAAVEAFVHAAFAQRRKQLAVVLGSPGARTPGAEGAPGLEGAPGPEAAPGREGWQRLLAESGHPPTARAEELTPAELVALRRRAAPDVA